MDADAVAMVTPWCEGWYVPVVIVGGLWPTYVVKRVVDKMAYFGCQLPVHGCVLYDPTVAVSPFTHYRPAPRGREGGRNYTHPHAYPQILFPSTPIPRRFPSLREPCLHHCLSFRVISADSAEFLYPHPMQGRGFNKLSFPVIILL